MRCFVWSLMRTLDRLLKSVLEEIYLSSTLECLIVDLHKVRVAKIVAQECRRIDPCEALKIVDEVRLIKIAAVRRDISPLKSLPGFDF